MSAVISRLVSIIEICSVIFSTDEYCQARNMIQAYVWHRQSTEWQAYDIFSKVSSKLTEQQSNIIRTFTQRRYFDWNCIQTIIQVFTETSFRYCICKIHVCSSNNTHICLLNFRRTYLNIFARLKDTQQTRLCG